jgi:catechol 2,3-dioxygenase-like lactoylglutathione lyase family enzyme
MRIEALDHFTVRCRPGELGPLSDFYTGVLGLEPGPRPDFSFPGVWLYANGKALVHLAGVVEGGGAAGGAGTGFDHVALRTHGLEDTRSRLAALRIAFDELPVPGFPLHQVFVRDPAGTRIELTFEVAP